jgi:threonyl-tRNA synthetase
MSSQMVALCQKNLKFERLEVNVDLALEMFKDNKHKTEQIPHIASQISEGKIFPSVFNYQEYQILMF